MRRTFPAALVAAFLASTINLAVPANAAEEKKTMANTDPAIVAIDKQIADLKIDKSNASWKRRLPKPTQVSFTAGRSTSGSSTPPRVPSRSGCSPTPHRCT